MAIAIAGTLLAASSAWGSTASATRRKRHHKTAVQAAPAPVPVPAPPPPPAYPVHDPAVPPEVSYVNGQLLIDAKNSTLADVLKAVEKDTGATFDISSGDTSERVVGRIGPGTPRDVMAELLNGSHFNYVMLSPIDNPSALSKVLLTPRSKGATTQTFTAQQQPQPQPFMQPGQISPALQVQQQPAAAEESADNGDNGDENADNQNQDQTEGQPDPQADAAQTVQPPQQPAGVKTPEQLLQELRQQQQQVIQQTPQAGQPEDNK
jgi:hypothetical protein